MKEHTNTEGTHNHERTGVLPPTPTGLEVKFLSHSGRCSFSAYTVLLIPVTDPLKGPTEVRVEQRPCHFRPTNPCLSALVPQLHTLGLLPNRSARQSGISGQDDCPFCWAGKVPCSKPPLRFDSAPDARLRQKPMWGSECCFLP